MLTVLIFFHVLLCLALIFLVLLQQGKGADLGAVFGNSNSVFGTSGADNIGKITTALAIVFMITSILLVRTFIYQAKDPKFVDAKATQTQSDVIEDSILNNVNIDDNAAKEANENADNAVNAINEEQANTQKAEEK